MANYFEYDSEIFSSTSKIYGNASTNLKGFKLTMDYQLSTMRKDWNSKAGETFFEKYDDDWRTIINQYIALLDFLKESIDAAIPVFDNVVTEAENISISEEE